ncbi:MAG: chorismate-binding protein [Prevotella sp.]|nr:chorismate-binding protein [Prevotella sp.]
MGAFAIYRLPSQTDCTLIVQHEGDPEVLQSMSKLNDRSGYVVAPFAITPDCPLLLVRADETARIPLFSFDRDQTALLTEDRLSALCPSFSDIYTQLIPTSDGTQQPSNTTATRLHYHIDFANFHSHLQSGEFQKIVLARCEHVGMTPGTSPLQLFQKACERYPRMFVTLFSTRESGTWLMATPEILLEGCEGRWRTIALAGTMDIPEGEMAEPVWSNKDIHEQRYVATYITECLEQFLLGEDGDNRDYKHDIEEEGPYTTQAANVLHLRSDFRFSLPEGASIGRLLRRLHPTPAVCGLPKQQTFDFILRNESEPRRYYSGFTGPIGIEGETHLFVSLRCMQIADDGCHLFAGGGLLRDSVEEQEWHETEAKLQAMKALLEQA